MARSATGYTIPSHLKGVPLKNCVVFFVFMMDTSLKQNT